MDDNQFRKLLERQNLSWAGYRKVRKGVKKRIRRHMKELGCRDIEAYLSELEKNSEDRKQYELLMTVSISRFFRDCKFWQTLQNELLPNLIKENKEKIKVWSVGCARGEEVYSLKIIWEQLKENIGNLPELEIIATDMNPACLERAKTGIYPSSSLKEVKKELKLIEACFEPKKGGISYEIKSFLKKDIIWKQSNLLSDPPGSGFNIIFLRNILLTYYQEPEKTTAFKKIIHSLSPSGLLSIGSHEKLPFQTDKLKPVEPYSFVFKKLF